MDLMNISYIHSAGNTPSLRHLIKIYCRGSEPSEMHNFNIGIDIHTVKSVGFSEFNLEIIYYTFSTETRIDLIEWTCND